MWEPRACPWKAATIARAHASANCRPRGPREEKRRRPACERGGGDDVATAATFRNPWRRLNETAPQQARCQWIFLFVFNALDAGSERGRHFAVEAPGPFL